MAQNKSPNTRAAGGDWGDMGGNLRSARTAPADPSTAHSAGQPTADPAARPTADSAAEAAARPALRRAPADRRTGARRSAARRARRAAEARAATTAPPTVLYIAGAGGVGREALDAALAAGRTVAAFLDDRLAGETVRGLPVLPTDEPPVGTHPTRPAAEYLIGIAAPDARRRLAANLDKLGLRPAVLVHPRAIIAPEVELAEGCLVLGGAHLSSSVRLGPHCQVHYNATVGHDTVLAARVSVYPGANLSGSVQLGADATVGSNAVVLQGLTVGEGAFVGAGAVVTRDVPPNTVVVGNPARPLRRTQR